MKKIALAYSGGLDTSVILTWLKETYGVPVVAFVADVGQNEDLAAVHEKALATGATEVVIADVREAFVRDYVFPALSAHAVYEGAYLLGTSLARPVIAKALVAAARSTGCDAVAHGATGKGNDQVRFELTVAALAPDLRVIAPWREWSFVGRSDLLAYAERHGIPVPVTAEKPYSMDANAMHISYEGGVLEDPWQPPPAGMFLWTTDPEQAPDEPALVDITFEAGVPVAIDGEALSPFRLLERANALGARHGIGRVDIVENRFIGLKSRGVYETPGATILMLAHRAVESLTLDREVAHFKETLAPKFAELVYNGFWFAPEMELLRATLAHTQRNVTGTARLKLYKGAAQVVGRKSPVGLYDAEAVSFETRTQVAPSDAGGFIAVQALRLRQAGRLSA
ncbi:MAG: argininosuccinate synthase [Chloracidobacterium sp.]|uniref:Argininosuccinate synthase n=1 Tax=Chloracidobacterium validum TaxID=2821543 RepID=A0ABX8BCI6_9BACT|nr:argininosuccinate synthase [Chloracidobacterium validum]QUW04627.1 argininosuccinate synthase [Chloracidobacterium validum]